MSVSISGISSYSSVQPLICNYASRLHIKPQTPFTPSVVCMFVVHSNNTKTIKTPNAYVSTFLPSFYYRNQNRFMSHIVFIVLLMKACKRFSLMLVNKVVLNKNGIFLHLSSLKKK